MNRKIKNLIYILLITVFAVSFFKLKDLPDKSKILNSLYQEPIQASSTSLNNFSFDYLDTNYNVKPIADYDLWGLVVSVNNIKAWYNMYHDKTSVNLKDICVIWGDNLRNDIYKEVNYKSGEWTCYASWGASASGKFDMHQLSNNHLFSDDENVRDVIKDMRIGDQIYLQGTLSEYAKNGQTNYRGTSLSRDDSGNGACETIYVQKAEILDSSNTNWYLINKISKLLFILLLLLQFIIFVINSIKTNLELKRFQN
ncbi:hypothetical protein C0583_05790 [Candidatus Parcubacteria bacterium]|nr:MAG: hypothetical protein C0583_05790 [Candidatus Parcubacteria bacterium]